MFKLITIFCLGFILGMTVTACLVAGGGNDDNFGH